MGCGEEAPGAGVSFRSRAWQREVPPRVGRRSTVSVDSSNKVGVVEGKQARYYGTELLPLQVGELVGGETGPRT